MAGAEPVLPGRSGEVLVGLQPPLALEAHAWAALHRLRRWMDRVRTGAQIRTRTGKRRILPTSLLRLARQYVEDHSDSSVFSSLEAARFANQAHAYALEAKLANIVQDLLVALWDSDEGNRKRALRWILALKAVGLVGQEAMPGQPTRRSSAAPSSRGLSA